MNKKQKIALLAEQHSLCACCQSQFSVTDRWYYDTQQNAVVCAKCWFAIIQLRAASERGVLDLLTEYMRREPGPE